MTREGSAISVAAARRYSDAMRDLLVNGMTEYAAGVDYETPEFLRLNREAAAAERGVPRLLRWLIDRRIIRELGYWSHTGGTG